MHGLQPQHPPWVGPAHGEVEDATAADGRELVPVPDQGDPGASLVRNREQGMGDVLVEHPSLVDQQQVTPPQPRLRHRFGCVDAAPVAAVVPTEPVLVHQPRRGGRERAELTTGDLGRLQAGCHHTQPMSAL